MTNENLIERLKILMVKLGIGSVTKWAKMLDIPQTTLDKKLRGEQKLDLRTLLRVIETHPEVRTDWLIRGSEPMFVGQEGYGTDNSLKDIQLSLLEGKCNSLTRRVERQNAEIEELHQDIKDRDDKIELLMKRGIV